MNNINPFKSSYDIIGKIDFVSNLFLIVSGLLTVLVQTNIVENFNQELSNISLVLMILFSTNKIFTNYFYLVVEKTRIKDYIDNSFGTNYSEEKSEEYFTNDDTSPGIYKLAVNCFENSIHTSNTLKHMIKNKGVWTLIFFLIFLYSAISGHGNFVRLFFEIALPILLIQEFITTCIFYLRMKEVKDEFYTIFNNLKGRKKVNKYYPQIIINILNYESALSWSSMLLSSRVFNKYNDKLSKKWNKDKKRLNIL